MMRYEQVMYEEWIMINKSEIARYEDEIIILDQELGGRGESSIIRYY